MEVNKTLKDDFVIRSIPSKDFGGLWVEHSKKIFEENQLIFSPRDFYSENEKENAKILSQNMGQPFRLCLGVFKNDKFVGWSWGIQEPAETFYMVNSAILPEYRRLGLYSMLLKTMIESVSKLGFQIIYSKHNATNNAVIIPKLKEGFTISSLEVSDMFGVLVHLRLYTNPLRQKMMEFRVGELKPDQEINNALKLS